MSRCGEGGFPILRRTRFDVVGESRRDHTRTPERAVWQSGATVGRLFWPSLSEISGPVQD